MSYTIQGGYVTTEFTKLTTTAVTTVLEAGQSGAIIVEINATEIAGATPALTLERYDGTTSTYYRYQKNMTAKEEYQRQSIIVLGPDDEFRATAGTANQIDISITYIPGDRTAKGSYGQ